MALRTPIIESSATWSSSFKLNLAMLSYSTGLTIPRLASPWLIRTKIGILLLVPIQLLTMFVVTIPCLFMELALGQYSNKAVIKVWDLCPVLRGIGICSFLTFFMYQTYYTFLCTCTLCFAFLSFTNEPHWKTCNKSWNKINCWTLRENYTRREECNQRYSREKCEKLQWQSSVEQFYFNRILNVDDTSGYVGPPQQELLVYALITMVVIFCANYGGPKSTEKFLVALAIIPTLQLIVLFFAPLTGNNGFLTLSHLFTQFDKSRLADPKIWVTMVKLSLSSPGLGFGAYITLGTHCSFRSPIHFKTIVISSISAFITVFYSIALQNFLVSLCFHSKMLMDDFFDLEQELAMPEAVFFLDHSSQFWMTMWLSNSYMLGLRSLIVMMSINAEVVYNSIPKARKRHKLCIFILCILIYSGGMFLSTRIGYFVVKTLDTVVNEFTLLFLNTFQLIGVVYFYGLRKFRDDIQFMLGIRTSLYWNTLYVLNPILLGSVLVYSIYDFYTTSETIRFKWIYNVENVFLWCGIALILLYGIFYACSSKKKLKIFKASENWGPRYGTLTRSRQMFTAYNVAKEYLYRQERFRQFGESEV